MVADEWFRNTQWSGEIEAHFSEKLRRAKDKSQYLRIQAGYLADSHPQVALRLLDTYFSLGEHFDNAQAYLDQAEAYLALGDEQHAISSLQHALQREREYPNVRTQAWSRYVLLIAIEGKQALFNEALSVLLEHKPDSTSFPVDVFRWHAAFALISDALGDDKNAREAASTALRWSEVMKSGLRHHPNVGLVGAEYPALKKRLRELIMR